RAEEAFTIIFTRNRATGHFAHIVAVIDARIATNISGDATCHTCRINDRPGVIAVRDATDLAHTTGQSTDASFFRPSDSSGAKAVLNAPVAEHPADGTGIFLPVIGFGGDRATDYT